jgi:hypothetical protein
MLDEVLEAWRTQVESRHRKTNVTISHEVPGKIVEPQISLKKAK